MGRSNNSFSHYVGGHFQENAHKIGAEQRLWIAVLTQAAHDAFKTADKFSRDSARSWLLGNSNNFRRVCEFAGRNPDYVREKIKKKILKNKGWYIV